MLEAERRGFSGEKLVLREELAQLKAMQEALQQRERSWRFARRRMATL